MPNIIEIFQAADFVSLFVFMVSAILTIGSLAEVLSKSSRQQMHERAIEELPENKAFLESKKGLVAARRARIATLSFGVSLFLAWPSVLRFWL